MRLKQEKNNKYVSTLYLNPGEAHHCSLKTADDISRTELGEIQNAITLLSVHCTIEGGVGWPEMPLMPSQNERMISHDM